MNLAERMAEETYKSRERLNEDVIEAADEFFEETIKPAIASRAKDGFFTLDISLPLAIFNNMPRQAVSTFKGGVRKTLSNCGFSVKNEGSEGLQVSWLPAAKKETNDK